MRCGTARRRISDDLDGALDPRRRSRLEAHLRSCAACRASRDALARLQAAAGPSPGRTPEDWAAFERRIASRLDDAGPGRAPVRVRRRWVWAAAGAGLALAVAGTVWYAASRPGTALTTAWMPAEDVLVPLIEEAEADPELGRDIERAVLDSIDDLMPVPDPDAAAIQAGDPLFWEGLSEDELRFIASELEAENGLGGAQ